MAETGFPGRPKKGTPLQCTISQGFARPHIDTPEVNIAELVHDDLDKIGRADRDAGAADDHVRD